MPCGCHTCNLRFFYVSRIPIFCTAYEAFYLHFRIFSHLMNVLSFTALGDFAYEDIGYGYLYCLIRVLYSI